MLASIRSRSPGPPACPARRRIADRDARGFEQLRRILGHVAASFPVRTPAAGSPSCGCGEPAWAGELYAACGRSVIRIRRGASTDPPPSPGANPNQRPPWRSTCNRDPKHAQPLGTSSPPGRRSQAGRRGAARRRRRRRDIVQVMGRHDRGERAARGHAVQDPQQRLAPREIEPGGRLVQQHELAAAEPRHMPAARAGVRPGCSAGTPARRAPGAADLLKSGDRRRPLGRRDLERPGGERRFAAVRPTARAW